MKAVPFTDIRADILCVTGPLAGRLEANQSLAPLTWFRVGGPAQLLYSPASKDELARVLGALAPTTPVTILGLGSNILVRDGGVAGLVIRLGRGFRDLAIMPHGQLRAGAGLPDRLLANAAAKAGIGGLEFFATIPGGLGGALRMNAGAHGHESKDHVVAITAINRKGEIKTLTPADMDWSYRHSGASEDLIFLDATFQGFAKTPEAIAEKISALKVARERAQPVREKTGGSTFKNPPGHKAWELIDAAGCRGLRLGGASVSEKHCNFLINNGTATAADLEALGEEVRARVKAHTQIDLEWEIRRIGVPL